MQADPIGADGMSFGLASKGPGFDSRLPRSDSDVGQTNDKLRLVHSTVQMSDPPPRVANSKASTKLSFIPDRY